MSRFDRQLRAAQRQYDNAYDADREAAEDREEAIDTLLDDANWRAANKAEADEWCEGMHDGEWYAQVETKLADLHSVEPSHLLGSDLLASLYALAETAAELRDKKLRDIAEREIDDARDAA